MEIHPCFTSLPVFSEISQSLFLYLLRNEQTSDRVKLENQVSAAHIQLMQRDWNETKASTVNNSQPRPHLCGRGEEIDDPGKGCPNLLVHWLTHSTSQGL